MDERSQFEADLAGIALRVSARNGQSPRPSRNSSPRPLFFKSLPPTKRLWSLFDPVIDELTVNLQTMVPLLAHEFWTTFAQNSFQVTFSPGELFLFPMVRAAINEIWTLMEENGGAEQFHLFYCRYFRFLVRGTGAIAEQKLKYDPVVMINSGPTPAMCTKVFTRTTVVDMLFPCWRPVSSTDAKSRLWICSICM